MKRSSGIYLTGLIIFFLAACKNGTQGGNPMAETRDSNVAPVSLPVFSDTAHTFELKVIEVKNSDSVSLGWGYDIYIDGARTIHQTTIPAIPGVTGFKSKKDAEITGKYAVNKMKATGTFPTLHVEELDSLGITLK